MIKVGFLNKDELKKLFNTEPGPGSYNHRRVKTQQGSRRKADPPGFDTGQERFIVEPGENLGPEDPGPGTYDAEKVKKHTMCLNFYNKPGAAPVFNENNPINYVRPITVNVYFKAENPPPGYYDIVDRPKTQSYQTGHRHLFTSQIKRELVNVKNEVPDVGAYDPDISLQANMIKKYVINLYKRLLI